MRARFRVSRFRDETRWIFNSLDLSRATILRSICVTSRPLGRRSHAQPLFSKNLRCPGILCNVSSCECDKLSGKLRKRFWYLHTVLGACSAYGSVPLRSCKWTDRSNSRLSIVRPGVLWLTRMDVIRPSPVTGDGGQDHAAGVSTHGQSLG